MNAGAQDAEQAADTCGGQIVRPAVFRDRGDGALLNAIRDGHAGASAQLYDRYAPRAQRMLMRCLGSTEELADALQDVFVEVFRSIHKLRDPSALAAWINRVAVYVARGRIRRKARRRWLRLLPPEELPEIEAPEAEPEVREALAAVYQILDRMAVDERIAFALRMIEGMSLGEIAVACDCSVATVQRRLKRAHARFAQKAMAQEQLRPWLGGQQHA